MTDGAARGSRSPRRPVPESPRDAGETAPLWLGPAPDASKVGSNGGVAGNGPGPRTKPAPPTRTKRYPDHRLRGLEIDGQILGEAPPRVTRRNKPYRLRRRRRIVQWVVVLAVAAVVALMLRVYVIEPFSVPSSAMAPTLQTGDQILVVTSRLVAGPIGRGDIVVFRSATSSRCGAARPGRQDLVKRVIGLPGETISSVGSSIDIDGRTLHESGWYSTGSGQVGSTPIPPTRIPAGHYFVMGDNRTNSCDSRSFGVISGSSVVGKVTAIITRNGHAYLHFL